VKGFFASLRCAMGGWTPGMLRIIALSACLVSAPYLGAEDFPPPNTPAPVSSSIYVFSDCKGTLYVDGDRVGKLRALSKNPLDIGDLAPGDHHLTQLAPQGRVINFDIELLPEQLTYVYLRIDQSRAGRTLSEIGYKPQVHDRTWVWGVVGTGALLLVAGVVVGVTALETHPIQNWML
jgi:hypothetical protein